MHGGQSLWSINQSIKKVRTLVEKLTSMALSHLFACQDCCSNACLPPTNLREQPIDRPTTYFQSFRAISQQNKVFPARSIYCNFFIFNFSTSPNIFLLNHPRLLGHPLQMFLVSMRFSLANDLNSARRVNHSSIEVKVLIVILSCHHITHTQRTNG